MCHSLLTNILYRFILASLSITFHYYMYEQTLIQAGLNQNQAIIYEILITNGSMPAGEICKKTPFKRGLVYKILDELAEIKLVEKLEKPQEVAIFSPAHPLKIKELAKEREEKAQDAQRALEGVLPKIISDFNLTIGKPGVRFFEGLDGIKQALEDTLVNNKEKKIFSYSDAAGYATYLKDWDLNHYALKRKELSIKEQMIIPNNPKGLAHMYEYPALEVTEIIFVDHKAFPFATDINIYSGKVSFVTFSEKAHIGVIVENPEIYQTMLSGFNIAWSLAKIQFADIQPGWAAKPIKSS